MKKLKIDYRNQAVLKIYKRASDADIDDPIVSGLYKIIKLSLCLSILLAICFFTACKKELQIAAPRSTAVTATLFADSIDATSAIEGIYLNMISGSGASLTFGSGQLTFLCGAST